MASWEMSLCKCDGHRGHAISKHKVGFEKQSQYGNVLIAAAAK